MIFGEIQDLQKNSGLLRKIIDAGEFCDGNAVRKAQEAHGCTGSHCVGQLMGLVQFSPPILLSLKLYTLQVSSTLSSTILSVPCRLSSEGLSS